MNLMTSVMPRKQYKQTLKIPDTIFCGSTVDSIFSLVYVVSNEQAVYSYLPTMDFHLLVVFFFQVFSVYKGVAIKHKNYFATCLRIPTQELWNLRIVGKTFITMYIVSLFYGYTSEVVIGLF